MKYAAPSTRKPTQLSALPANEMLGSTLYLVGREAGTGNYVENPSSCSMCKRQIINAGIAQVVVRLNKTQYSIISVSDWIENDESLEGRFGY